MYYELIKEKVIKYMESFDLSNPKIIQKIKHTQEVVTIIEKIAINLKLEEKDIVLAKVVALLHDIGRFEQIKNYETQVDYKTIDHADLGVHLLFKESFIKQLDIPICDYNIIEKTIRLHNKLKIEEHLDNRELLFVNLIRDADKIDIFRVRIYEMKNRFYDEPSQKVLTHFYEEKSIDIKDNKNKSDSIICILSFIYDINYLESIKVLEELNYINLFIDVIEQQKETEDIFSKIKEKVLNYIKKRINGEENEKE